MNRSSCHPTLRTTGAARRSLRTAAAGLAIAIGLSTVGGPAQAQITSKMLIGDAVADIGPKHVDIEEAIKKFSLRDVIGARAHLDLAKQKDPTLPPTDLILAKMYILTGNAAAGRTALEKTALENPSDPEPYLLYADQTLSGGGTIEADALYDKVLQLAERFTANPIRQRNFFIRGRMGRALIAERRKNWAGMATELQTLLKIDPYHAGANYRLGVALCMQDNFRDGFAAFQKARTQNKDLLNPYLSAALMYDQMNRQSDAKRLFEEALRNEPKDLSTITNYSQWLIKTGALADAEAKLAAARRDHPDSLDLFTLSGVAARMNGKPAEAEQYFVTALGKAPAHIIVMNQLATLLIGQDDDDKQRAIQFAAMNSKLNPESADASITLAWVHHKLGRAPDSMNALRTGLQQGNLSPDSSYLVAEMIAAQNRPEDIESAKRVLKEALASDNAGMFVHRKEAQDLLKRLGG